MDLYTDGGYLEKNETWHTEDSPWKANQVLRLLKQNQITPKTVGEIGCGAGEILVQLHNALPDDTQFFGFDISPQLEPMWETRKKDRISFFRQDIFENEKTFDVLLYLDVLEHIEDYIGFLRKTQPMGQYKIFNFPLEIFAWNVLSRKKLTMSRRKDGHIHHFNKEKVLDLFEDLQLEVLDYFYAPIIPGLGNLEREPGLRRRLTNIPKKILSHINLDFAAKLLGGYSLYILAK